MINHLVVSTHLERHLQIIKEIQMVLASIAAAFIYTSAIAYLALYKPWLLQVSLELHKNIRVKEDEII